jgi:DNA-directed RNA polymerase beta subunit
MGKSSGGGLRIGEMERDALCSHGSSRFINEKYRAHSDEYTEYICSCGKTAVCNIAKGIYKCNYCRDNADIVAVPTSWSAKLFIQELESIRNWWKDIRNNILVLCYAKSKIFKLLESLSKLLILLSKRNLN